MATHSVSISISLHFCWLTYIERFVTGAHYFEKKETLVQLNLRRFLQLTKDKTRGAKSSNFTHSEMLFFCTGKNEREPKSNSDWELIGWRQTLLCFRQSPGRLSWWILDEAVDQRMRDVADDETHVRVSEWVGGWAPVACPAQPRGVLILGRLDGPSVRVCPTAEHSDRLLTYGQLAAAGRRRRKCVPRRLAAISLINISWRRRRANGAQNALYSTTATEAVSGVVR